MQKVKTLGEKVKGNAAEIITWMSKFSNGDKPTKEDKANWKKILGEWKTILKVAKDQTQGVRKEF